MPLQPTQGVKCLREETLAIERRRQPDHQARWIIQETEGPYGDEGFIYQSLAHIPAFDEVYPVLGSWVIDGTAAGIGIRESFSPTTDNLSCFVPHLFE